MPWHCECVQLCPKLRCIPTLLLFHFCAASTSDLVTIHSLVRIMSACVGGLCVGQPHPVLRKGGTHLGLFVYLWVLKDLKFRSALCIGKGLQTGSHFVSDWSGSQPSPCFILPNSGITVDHSIQITHSIPIRAHTLYCAESSQFTEACFMAQCASVLILVYLRRTPAFLLSAGLFSKCTSYFSHSDTNAQEKKSTER